MVLFGSLGLTFVSVIFLLSNGLVIDDSPSVLDPADVFQQLTSWQLPSDAVVLANKNTHGGFTNDGDYTLVVKLPAERLTAMLQKPDLEWKDCPIPQQILDHGFSFPQHSGEFYYAEKTMESDEDWHRGFVVIVDTRIATVWVYEWKT